LGVKKETGKGTSTRQILSKERTKDGRLKESLKGKKLKVVRSGKLTEGKRAGGKMDHHGEEKGTLQLVSMKWGKVARRRGGTTNLGTNGKKK